MKGDTKTAWIAPTVGVVVAAASGFAVSRPSLVEWPGRLRPIVGVTVGGLTGSVGSFIAATAVAVARRPGHRRAELTRRVVQAGVSVGSVLAVALAGRAFVAPRTENTGRALDPALSMPPASSCVSGSSESLVPLATLGREGARFVHSRVPQAVIEQVWGEVEGQEPPPPIQEPIRVFIGVDSASSVQERVALAMAELARTDAFSRRTWVVAAPAGSGYANPTPISIVEIATRGDCATVVVGYGLRPSFLSLDRIPVAVETQAALHAALLREVSHLPQAERPRVLLYGESLGARVQQGALDLAQLRLFDHSLWVGTPGGRDADTFRHSLAEVRSPGLAQVTLDRPEQIPADHAAEIWFLEHDADPVVRFAPALLWRRPAWLTGSVRGREVPPRMRWWPLLTWVQVLIDTLFATRIEPGNFDNRGHDYRADLGAVTMAAYGLHLPTGGATRLEQALRSLERHRAEVINSTG